MANSIQCTIWGEDKEGFAKILEAIKWKGSPFSYNALDPMPEALSIEAKSDLGRKEAKMAVTLVQSSLAPDFKGLHPYLDALRREYSNSPEHPRTTEAFKAWLLLEKPEIIRYGQQLLKNRQKYGYETWYEWRLDHWGVKWDVSDDDLEINDDDLMVRWEAPWSAPIPVIRMISEKVGVPFSFEWCDLDDLKGWHSQEWEGGVMTHEDFEPDPEYQEEEEDLYAVLKREHPDSMFM